MSMGKSLYLIVLCICIYGTNQAWAEKRSCNIFSWESSQVAHSSLNQIFKDNFSNSTIYKPSYCYNNVYRLFKLFQHLHPGLKAGDFKVYFFTTKYWVQYRDEQIKFQLVEQRKNPQVEFTSGWKFHVVLEYKGVIYDFDFSNQAQPMKFDNYISRFFDKAQVVNANQGVHIGGASHILVYKIPGRFFLEKHKHIIDVEEFHYLLFKKFKPKPLTDYNI